MFLISNLLFYMLLLFSFLLFFMSLYFLNMNMDIYIEYNLLSLNSILIKMIILLDWVSLIFMSFVLLISSMIFKYSKEYMGHDKNFKKFMLLLLLFVLSMMFMIMSPNLVSILLGWDGLGLISYLLVIFYQNTKSFNAGMLTALSNRVGDAAILMSIALLVDLGSWNLLNYMEFNNKMNLLGAYIFLASITKSAQIPFSAWLPSAMAAPTPVSSLVHSSTLVTAGVYLLFRFSDLFSFSLMSIMMYLSLLTMFMAGLNANFEFDLKKIIALSTLSQLGMMIFIMSIGGKELAFFHLLIHALFKALLFMCAGVYIHSLNNCQDIRYMGGNLLYNLPVTSVCFFISNFALCGLPFLSGFYSKDLIAEFMSMSLNSLFVYIIFFLSVGLTVSYSIRLFYYMFFGESNILSLNNISDENNKIMLKSMMLLIVLVIFMGSILSWFIFPTCTYIILPLFMKIMTIIIIIFGGLMGWKLSNLKIMDTNKSLKFLNFSMFFSSMWNLPVLSTSSLNYGFLMLGKIYMKNFDQGWMEYYGSNHLFKLMKQSSQLMQVFSHNHLKFCLLMFLIVFIFFLII